jgi:hypothetical protein
MTQIRLAYISVTDDELRREIEWRNKILSVMLIDENACVRAAISRRK